MSFNVTELVNNVVLPQVESSDIIGLERINEVMTWLYLPYSEPLHLAIGYSCGAILSILLTEGCSFVGIADNNTNGVEEDVKRITERIKTHPSFT